MDIQINTNISKEFENVVININAPEITKDLQMIINNLSNLSATREELVATKNNEIFLIKSKDILYFYSDDKNVYAKVNNEVYKVREKLYELEEFLPRNKFIRISNSCIINIEKTVSFDASIIGSLVAKMEDNSKQDVSKRRISNVMKFLKERK